MRDYLRGYVPLSMNIESLSHLLQIVDGRIIPTVQWDCTLLPEKGRDNWIEVSARPSTTMQLFISSLICILMTYLSKGRSTVEVQRYRRSLLLISGTKNWRYFMLDIVFSRTSIREFFGMWENQ